MNTIAKLFDPRGGHSVIHDRCEVCNELLRDSEGSICDTCEGNLGYEEDEDE